VGRWSSREEPPWSAYGLALGIAREGDGHDVLLVVQAACRPVYFSDARGIDGGPTCDATPDRGCLFFPDVWAKVSVRLFLLLLDLGPVLAAKLKEAFAAEGDPFYIGERLGKGGGLDDRSLNIAVARQGSF
jgi:hypothetical protein